ncbi:MAG: hypothetical protein R2880_09990 [Deinococcales bacterium]
MAYRDFSLAQVIKSFDLKEGFANLFPAVKALSLSAWLKTTLDISLKLAFSSSSEKARSEFIISPILLELSQKNPDRLAVFSGERLDVDESKGLKGECDFLLAKGPLSLSLQQPFIAVIEAKRNDIREGLGQCVAQMLGMSEFNQREGFEGLHYLYGCVTTGEDWQFLRLEPATLSLTLDSQRYYLSNLDQILGIFQTIIDEAF